MDIFRPYLTKKPWKNTHAPIFPVESKKFITPLNTSGGVRMFHRRTAIVSDSALRALRFRRRNPIEAAFHGIVRTISSLLGLVFILTVSLLQALDRG
ncbi:MAG: hypothetical protein IKU14_00605, partial [Rhodocyclaceae bacterium]|nr:hypothetical protein [Rhodocyclaceae bacterium]